MAAKSKIAGRLGASLRRALWREHPYRRWYPTDVLPGPVARAVEMLPFTPPMIGDTRGRRETHNSSRRFFDSKRRREFPVCDAIASAFECAEVMDMIESVCGVDVDGTYLRIEHCLDTDGFWLAPHTDLGVKTFTMLLYLSTASGHEAWGTDVYANAETLYETAPGTYNSALVFVPAPNTWHGFHKRPIRGIRRSLIVNYVTDEWRSRHELADPERPVSRRA